MPLQKQYAEIPLNGGLDTKQADELQSANTLTSALNLRFRKSGRLEKRSTYHATTGTFDADNEIIDTLFANQGRPIALGRTQGCGSLQGTTLELPGDVDPPLRPVACRVSRLVAAQTQETANSYGLTSTACAAINGQIVTAHAVVVSSTASSLVIRVFDAATGELVKVTSQPVTALSGLVFVQACQIASQNAVLIAWTSGSALPFSINGIRYDTATSTFGSPIVMASGVLPDASFAICESTTTNVTGGGFYLGYEDDASGDLVVTRRQYSDLTTILATHTGTHGASAGVSICDNGIDGAMVASVDNSTNVAYMELFGSPGTAQVLLVGASNNLSGVAIGYGLDGSNRAATAIVNVVAAAIGGTVANSFTPIYSVAYVRSYASSPTAAYQQTLTGVYAISHGVTIDNLPHFAVATDVGERTDDNQSYATGQSGLLVRVRPASNAAPDVVARFGHDRMAGFTVIQQMSALTMYDRAVYTAHMADPAKAQTMVAARLPQASFVAKVQFGAATDAFPLSSTEHSGATLVASGELFDFDGQWPIETQPRGRPRLTVEYGSGSGVTTTGTLSLCALYTFVDQAGRLHRSAPSAVVTVPAVTDKQIDAYVPAPPLPAYQGFGATGFSEYTTNYGIELYATEDGGSTFYLAHNSSGRKLVPDNGFTPEPFFKFSGVQPGDPEHPALYSDGSAGSELWSEPPPPMISVATIGDRVWGIDAEDRSRIWYSKPLVPGYAVEWNTACSLVIGDKGVAVADVNGTAAVFGERGIWVIPGEGPNANGVGSFAPAQRLPHEVETICPTSVCKTPAGVAFRARRGISMLGFGFDMQPIGLPIDLLMPTVTQSSMIRAVYDDQHSELRVIDHAIGSVYVFHMLEQKWTNWGQSSSDGLQNQRDACVANGRVWYAHKPSSGPWQLRRELGGDETDHNLSAEAVRVVSAWIRLENVAGFGRLRRITLPFRVPGEPAGKLLTVTAHADYDDSTNIGTQVYTLTDLGEEGDFVFVVMQPSVQRVSALRLTLIIQSLGSSPWGGWIDSGSDVAGYPPAVARIEYAVQPGGRRNVANANNKG